MKREAGITGAELMLNNAVKLRSSAEALARIEHYGHATSLLILAAEEALKAIVFCASANGIEVDPEGEIKYKRWHKARHGLASKLLFIGTYIKRNDIVVNDAECIDRKIINVLRRLYEDVQSDEVPEEVYATLSWWKGANDLKQRGMYVDEAPGGWVTPSEFPRGTYVEAYNAVGPIIDAARIIRVLEKRGYVGELKSFVEVDYVALERELVTELRLVDESTR